MPKKRVYNKSTGRDYSYDTKYESSSKQKKNRAQRNKARAMMKKKVGAKRLEGLDVNHRKPMKKGGKSVMSNLNIESKRKNRGRK
jgi:hypothetical protein